MDGITKQRIDWVDITKGIAIFLMVMGHTSMPKVVSNWIWSFHMPLFFIMSGMFFRVSSDASFLDRLNKDIKRIAIPYIFFLFCVVIFNLVWQHPMSFSRMLLGNDVGQIWFLQTLFFSHITFFVVLRFIKNEGLRIVAIIFLGALSYTAYIADVHMPYGFDIVGLAVVHMAFGYYAKSRLSEIKINPLYNMVLIVCVFVLSNLFPRLDMASNNWGGWIEVLLSWIGTFTIIQLSKDIAKWRNNNVIKLFF